MLVVPRELARVGVERHRRVREERLVEQRQLPAQEVPRLGLRHAPVGEIEIGIVAAGDPGVAAAAERHRQLAPRLAARLSLARHRVEAPCLLAGVDVVRTDEAADAIEARAARQPLQHFVADDDRAARVDASGVGRCIGIPKNFAVARAQRHHVGVARRQEDLVVGNRDAADAAVARRLVRARTRLPDQTARLSVERLDDVARRREIDDAVVHDRGGLVRARIVHRPHPLQLQVLHVGRGDLIQRAVALALIVAAENQPVSRGRVLEHFGRDGNVVPHFARHGDAAIRFTSTATARRRSRADDRRGRRAAATPAAAATCCGRRRLSRPDQQRADRRFDACRQRLLSGASAVDLQQQGGHRECAFLTQRARVRWGHRLDERREKLVDRARAPLGAEVFALERWRVGGSAKILAVAPRALLRIRAQARLRLCGGEHSRRRQAVPAGRPGTRC